VSVPDRLATAIADRYRIEAELGQGGMATVYLAADVKHDRKVALKVLKPELAAVLGADRFVQEIKTTAALQHPHILPLFDSGSVDGFLYYVMPYVEGETLRAKLDREKQLGIDEAVKITTEVADALDYAHRHGIIHRDIKPENILLHDGRPIVADFGIALALSAAAGGRMTETGLSLGTPHYMSPEQATAEKEITARSDVYSLGCVLFEMLTGNPPHTGASAQQIIMKIVTEDAQDVTALRKSVPPHVAAALAKALEKLPADRFGSAAEFGSALADPHFAERNLAVARDSSARATGWKRRFYLASGACALLGIAALFLVLNRGGAAIGADMSVEQHGDPVAMSPDKRWVLSIVLTNPIQYRLYPTGAGQAVPVNWDLEATGSFDFFPDGHHLFVCGNAPRKAPACYRSALDGSALESLLPDSVPEGRLRPDGEAVGYAWHGAAWVRSLADGGTRHVSWPNAFAVLRWSPDGTAIWGYQGRDRQHLEQLNMATGRLAPLVTLELPPDVSAETLGSISLADDPHVYAYLTNATTSLIFSIRGVR
jgi:tRNA A-37 threonylcarbamoyl transferase component Bud32